MPLMRNDDSKLAALPARNFSAPGVEGGCVQRGTNDWKEEGKYRGWDRNGSVVIVVVHVAS